jgi:hypothetical protein
MLLARYDVVVNYYYAEVAPSTVSEWLGKAGFIVVAVPYICM